MDAVVIAELVDAPAAADVSGDEVPKAKFLITEVIKGQELLKESKTIETIYFGAPKKDRKYLIMGVDPPNLMWSTPLAISDKSYTYLRELSGIAKEGADRLAFFQKYLEDEDELLARDAYDEFARAPYADVKALKSRMKREQLLTWIQDMDIPASRRRLYLTMLGVCGTAEDLPMLEKMMESSDRKMKAGLDAMVACYLTLSGGEGMPKVEELFLANPDAEYADTYAAIMALRFHAGEDVIERERILEGLRHLLDRPPLADLVIPDLTKYEDWSQTEKLVQLFKDADDKSSWVRVPVINFLRKNPDPKAAEYLEELEKIDPAAVKRAKTFFPIDDTPKAGEEIKASWQRPEVPEETEFVATDAAAEPEVERDVVTVTPASRATETVAPVAPAVNLPALLGVVWVSAAIVMLVQWKILAGAARPT